MTFFVHHAGRYGMPTTLFSGTHSTLNLFVKFTMETLTYSDNPEACIPLHPPDLIARLETIHYVRDQLYNMHGGRGWPQVAGFPIPASLCSHCLFQCHSLTTLSVLIAEYQFHLSSLQLLNKATRTDPPNGLTHPGPSSDAVHQQRALHLR